MDGKQENARRRRRLHRRRRIRRIARAAALLIVIAAVGALAYGLVSPLLTQQAQELAAQRSTQTAQVTRGTIEKTVFGAGTVQPASQPGVYATVEATVSATLA